MSILEREALEASPLADLHAIASELSIDGYRRLRKEELIEAILSTQEREQQSSAAEDRAPEAGEDEEQEPDEDEGVSEPEELTGAVADELHARDEGRPSARSRRRRGAGRARGSGARGEPTAPRRRSEEPDEQDERDEQPVEGVVELLPNGSGFVRVDPPEPSEDDVYVSAAQVKRCELISGDRVSGPRRPPRRSERFASLLRVDTINGRPSAEVIDSTRFDDLPAEFPSEHFELGSDDATIKAIEWLTPFGRGSRVLVAGPAVSGKTETLRRLVAALADNDQAELLLVVSGVRPEELSEWTAGPVEPTAAVTLASSPDAQAQAIERVVDQGRRLAARGAHAVVVVDTLEGLPPGAARKALASARNIVEVGGSLTVIASAVAPLGGETTLIVLDALRARTGRFPAIDLTASWTLRPELLVGESGAEAIARARAEAMDE